MPDETAARVHPAEHCYHQLAPLYGLAVGDVTGPAIPEFCCWCPGIRLTAMVGVPEAAAEHGPSLRFMEPPKPAPVKPVRGLIVPGPRLVH